MLVTASHFGLTNSVVGKEEQENIGEGVIPVEVIGGGGWVEVVGNLRTQVFSEGTSASKLWLAYLWYSGFVLLNLSGFQDKLGLQRFM